MSASCIRRLQNMYKELQAEPVEGLLCEIPDESNMLEWNIWMEGPPDSPFAKGVFKLIMTFPHTFPMEPPELRFASDFWHPNVYKDGKVCISILHAPGEDALSVMLSVISMLSDPNISSPANLDASLEWRNERPKYVERCKRLVEKANREKPDHIVIPHPESDPHERAKRLQKQKLLMDDDFMMDSDDGYGFESDGGDDDDFAYDDDEILSEEEEESEEKPPKKSKSSEKGSKDSKTSKTDSKKSKSESKDKKKDDTKKSSSKKTEDKKSTKDKTGKADKKDKEKAKEKEKAKSSKTKDSDKLKEKEKSKDKEKEKEKSKGKSSSKSDVRDGSSSKSKDKVKTK